MSVKSVAKVPPLRAIGHESPECPYCREPLEKPIKQKKVCNKCDKTIYPRKRPIDGKVVYFREDELDALEEQRAIAYGTYDVYLEQKYRKEAAMAKLRKKLGRDRSANDVKWSLLNDDLVSAAQMGHWGVYRNVKLNMAELLQSEGKFLTSLESWIEVAIFDMNGATNVGIISDKESKDMDEMSKLLGYESSLCPFTLRLGMLLDYTIDNMRSCLEALTVSESVLSQAFDAAWERMPVKKLLPLSRIDAWARISQRVVGF